MNHFKRYFPIVFILLISCDDDELSKNYPPKILKTWVASYEEGANIYRPADYFEEGELAPSWYRPIYELKTNNNCEYLFLSPVDAHYMTDGKWEYLSDSKQVRIYDLDDRLIYKFRVEELSHDLLKMEPL